jgi:phosphoribosylaminoimidazolecarboxamide formyltransferase / IMP cyclohydrolase
MPKVQRALLSVTNKTGIVDFARALAGMGVELVSTGGTARVLREAGLEVRDISDLTGFPEMLDGRVKTLHPKVHGGILAMRANPEHQAALAEHGIETIDMVVINLYEFEIVAGRFGAPVSELIENIDIGGPSMIRSAAKNYQDVAVVVSPGDYGMLLEELRAHGGDLPLAVRWELARKAFRLTAAYDAAITARLARIEVAEGEFRDAEPPALPVSLDLHVPRLAVLRYGENPHQSAACYAAGSKGIAGAELLHGKELSYNNLVDLDAAWQLILEFEQPASAIIKHTNPCGCAEQATLEESYRAAFAADPVSAFGGVLAFNRPVNLETAEEIAKTFIEAIAAPDYAPAALERLTKKKNLRLLRVSQPELDPWVLKSISGGYLLQSADHHVLLRADARVASERAPNEQEWKALEFGWKVAKHVKSNAIVYARAGQIVGVGAGQMSRVDSVKIGAMKAVLPLEGTVVASDAFFPFPDGVEEAARHGITAVIQPGGSVRDEEVVAAANRLGLAMVLTGIRHFRH